jgi:hypothetical protein
VNGTVNADYETGTKIASNISAGKFRFTGTDGFKLIFYDKSSLLARDCSMSKGNYVLGWYVYDQATGGLTQSQNADFATMVTKVSDIFADVNVVIENQGVINVGVKKSSLLIPHTTNVAT